jgi:hypothetical protein
LSTGKRCKAADWARTFARPISNTSVRDLREIIHVLADVLEEIGDKHAGKGHPSGISSMKDLHDRLRAEKLKRKKLEEAARIFDRLVAAKGALKHSSAAEKARARGTLRAAGVPLVGRTFITRAREHAASEAKIENVRDLRDYLKARANST